MSLSQIHPDFSASLPPVQPDLIRALEAMAQANIEERGAIFTKRSVVDFILDLVGYTQDKPLFQMSLLEPSFGRGDFLMVAVRRLLESWKSFHAGKNFKFEDLKNCICAVELHSESFFFTRDTLLEVLKTNGASESVANRLCDAWLIQSDFLLVDLPIPFNFVIGNPPYVRQERISSSLITAYRKRYHTLFDRADLYIPFIERSLNTLTEEGHLGFICSDRWTKNRYGGPLRELVHKGYHLKIYVDMVGTQAFYSDVAAYPAITVIARQKKGGTRIIHRPKLEEGTLKSLARELKSPKLSGGKEIREIKGVTNGKEPWILDSQTNWL